MSVVAALCWYDEEPEALRKLVLSLEGVAETLVAADGPFALYGGPPESPEEQREALVDAASDAGLVLVTIPGRVWTSQTAKRKLLTSWVGGYGGPEDWMLVVDADEWVLDARPAELRRLLELTPLDVGYVSGEDTGRRGELGRWRRLFRCRRELTVIDSHHGYVLAGAAGEFVRLHGDLRDGPLEPAVDASRLLILAHDAGRRPFERQKAARRYYVLRNQSEMER